MYNEIRGSEDGWWLNSHQYNGTSCFSVFRTNSVSLSDVGCEVA